ncbi:BON domain-containing protein [Hymenobacter arizonensis]|uniref:BON domain-containing protein n=1 Tax=Hymenobacter arizonensis TaxID=1227077 RepID=A0A1I5U656_HYMAR|nr:BON domain-containing protein [Hymenobacter arizonensis]SFP90056.1 BON domain-containing protein [Hymenobacter arizonensis]
MRPHVNYPDSIHKETFAAPLRCADADLTAAVELLLLKKGVCSNLSRVVCHNGTVELVGSTDTLQSQEKAAEMALAVQGVQNVVNKISIRPLGISDAELHQRMAAALASDAVLAQCRLSVSVRNGRAHLSGRVTSASARARATDIARRVCGVVEVDNHTQVVE